VTRGLIDGYRVRLLHRRLRRGRVKTQLVAYNVHPDEQVASGQRHFDPAAPQVGAEPVRAAGKGQPVEHPRGASQVVEQNGITAGVGDEHLAPAGLDHVGRPFAGRQDGDLGQARGVVDIELVAAHVGSGNPAPGGRQTARLDGARQRRAPGAERGDGGGELVGEPDPAAGSDGVMRLAAGVLRGEHGAAGKRDLGEHVAVLTGQQDRAARLPQPKVSGATGHADPADGAGTQVDEGQLVRPAQGDDGKVGGVVDDDAFGGVPDRQHDAGRARARSRRGLRLRRRAQHRRRRLGTTSSASGAPTAPAGRAANQQRSERKGGRCAPSPTSRHAPRLAGARLALVLAALCGGVVVALETRVVRLGGVGPGGDRLLAGILIWWALLVPAGLLLRHAGRAASLRRPGLVVVIGITVVLQSAALTRGSQISDDLYRYAWDGRVQAAGIDPYRYAPNAPELAGLRDPWLWPDAATCQQLHKREQPCTRINRPPAHTIYPPVAEAWLTAVHALPGPSRDHHQQLYASLVSLGLMLLLARELVRRGRSPLLAAAYGWSPVAGLDIASDAHVDVLAALLGLAAVLAAERSWRADRPERPGTAGRRRPLVVGLLLGLATAVKVYPALLLPALARRSPVRAVASFASVIAVVYVPHVLAVGVGVLGYLPGYLSEEQYAQGGRFLLLGLLGVTGSAVKVVAVGLLSALAVAVARSHLRPAEATLAMLGGTFLVVDPVQPWYAVLLVVLAILTARLEWIAFCIAGYPLYVAALLHRDTVTAGTQSYGLASAFVLVVALLRLQRRKVTAG